MGDIVYEYPQKMNSRNWTSLHGSYTFGDMNLGAHAQTQNVCGSSNKITPLHQTSRTELFSDINKSPFLVFMGDSMYECPPQKMKSRHCTFGDTNCSARTQAQMCVSKKKKTHPIGPALTDYALGDMDCGARTRA